MFTWAGPLAALDEPLAEVAAGVPVLEAEPDEGIAVPVAAGMLVDMAVGVLAAPPEELLEDGLVGHRLLPVTGTTGVVVPLGALGDGVPLAVLGAAVAAGVPVVGIVVAPWVKTEVEKAADGEEAAGVPVPPVTGTPAVPVAD